jgi:NitT/TauT family transport system permease protein
MNKQSWLVTLILLLGIEVLLRFLVVPDYILPLPTQVFVTFWNSRLDLLAALWETSTHTLFGLLVSFFTGTLLAILISLSSWLRAGILPLALFFQTVPVIAIAPMLVIWFGFGAPTVISSATIVSFFPILASTLQGLESTPKASIELLQMYRANLFTIYWKLRIPYAAPWIFNGMRIAMGLAVVGALVGEFIGGGGLGSLIDSARTQQRTDLVFAAVLGSCILGWLLTTLLELSKKWLFKKWLHHS